MSDSFSFTPPAINTSCLNISALDSNNGNTHTPDTIALCSSPTSETALSFMDVGGYLAVIMDGGTLTPSETIGINTGTLDDQTPFNGYHFVSEFNTPTGVTSTPWESCFSDYTGATVTVYSDCSIPTNGLPHAFYGAGSVCKHTLQKESVHNLASLTTTLYTADYCAYQGAPTKCQVSTTGTEFTDNALTDPKTSTTTGICVFNYSV